MTMKLQAVSNRKLYLQIADQIREQIADGTARQGDQLPSERELASSLGVSRPTVREALIALEVAGLIDVRVGVGAFVSAPNQPVNSLPETGHSPLEVMAVRRLLEPAAAASAADNIDEAGKARLVAIAKQMRAETKSGTWSPENDRALHLTVAEGSGNGLLRELLDQLWNSRSDDVDERFHRHLADMESVRQHIMADHDRIVKAIVAGDRLAARDAMDAHLAFVENAMLTIWD